MTYSVIREDGVRVEGLTKEQVYELIYGTTGKVPAGVDEGFITKLKEQRAQADIGIWVGTNAEYNALETKEDDVLYIVTDDPFFEELDERLTTLEGALVTMGSTFEQTFEQMKSETEQSIQDMETSLEEYMVNLMNQKTADVDEWMAEVEAAL